MLHCKFSGDYDRERIFKIGQYLTIVSLEHLGFTFLAHPVQCAINDESLKLCWWTSKALSAGSMFPCLDYECC